MRPSRGHGRLRAAVLSLPLLMPLLLAGAPVSAAEPVSAAAPAERRAAPVERNTPARGDVAVRIDNLSPSVAPRSSVRLPLQIRVTLTNTSGAALENVRIRAVRGDPISSQKALDASMADAGPPGDGIDIPATRPLEVDLPTATPVTTTFTSTISVLNDDRGLCQCQNVVYPVSLTASAPKNGGGSVVLGSATTYVPSQLDPVKPVTVSWVWPLLERPHRLGDDTAFVDDDLATSVSGGRLDRALQVIERLKPTTPVTLVVDPELLDELEVMAGGTYTVRTTTTTSTGTKAGTTPGTGQVAARDWLDRFAALLGPDRAVQVSLTPYADPDIQSLAESGLTWATDLPTDMQQRVTAALAGRPRDTDVAWPASGTVGAKALGAMAASGVSTVVLDGSTLSPRTTGGLPVAVAQLRSSSGTVTAATTSPAMQRLVAQAIGSQQPGTAGSAPLPYLVAELAVRALQNDNQGRAVLTPPRYVDPDPALAARVIETTSSSVYTTPLPVRSLAKYRPTKVSTLRGGAPAPDGLPAANLQAADDTASALPDITSLLARDADAQPLVDSLGLAEQRITSSAWRPVSGSSTDTALGTELARTLEKQVSTLLDGVRIITPDGASYTLGSKDSRLPITVENTLPYTVVVDVEVVAKDRVPGYSSDDITPPLIAPDSKETVQVPSRLDRSGRIAVYARLTTPTGSPLGSSVLVYVRSTVFGTIGIVITFVAGGVLLLALVVRLIRRLQRLRRKAVREAGDSPADERGAADRAGAAST